MHRHKHATYKHKNRSTVAKHGQNCAICWRHDPVKLDFFESAVLVIFNQRVSHSTRGSDEEFCTRAGNSRYNRGEEGHAGNKYDRLINADLLDLFVTTGVRCNCAFRL